MQLSPIEEKLLALEKARENKSKENWFATKPSQIQHTGHRQSTPSYYERASRTRVKLESTASNEDLEPLVKIGERKSIYGFLLHHFEELDALIPEDPEMDDDTRNKKLNEILNLYNSKGYNKELEGDQVAWSVISKTFTKRYVELKRDKGIA